MIPLVRSDNDVSRDEIPHLREISGQQIAAHHENLAFIELTVRGFGEPRIHPDDDHFGHVEVHLQLPKTPLWNQMSSEGRVAHQEHVQAHLRAIFETGRGQSDFRALAEMAMGRLG